MCGIVGIVDFNRDISNNKNILVKMNSKLQKRGPDEEGYYIEKHVNLGHKRLAIIDIEGGKQPFTIKANDNIYTITYNGQLYNCDELRKELKELGYIFNTHSHLDHTCHLLLILKNSNAKLFAPRQTIENLSKQGVDIPQKAVAIFPNKKNCNKKS